MIKRNIGIPPRRRNYINIQGKKYQREMLNERIIILGRIWEDSWTES